MFLDWPLLVRLPLELLLWTWVVVGPGIALTALLTQGRALRLTEAVGLVAGLGMVAVPSAGYLFALLTGYHYHWWFPLGAATVANLAYLPHWQKGLRIRLSEEATPALFWVGLAVVLVVGFFTYDATLLHSNVLEYDLDGRADCFRTGTFLFIGLDSSAVPWTEPPLSTSWDGVVRGNVMLSATYLHLFGTSGFRYCRIGTMLLLAIFGWLLGERLCGNRKGAVIGLAALALNPYVVMIPDLDRNVFALAYSAILFFLAQTGLAGPLALGALAGIVTGMGLNLMPMLFLVPLTIQLRVVQRWSVQNLLVLWGVGVLVGLGWAAHTGVPPMVPLPSHKGFVAMEPKEHLPPLKELAPEHDETRPLVGQEEKEPGPPPPETSRIKHEFLGFEFDADRPMAWPFHHRITRGPDQPWPAFLFHLLDVARTLGVLFLAIAGYGFLLWWRRNRWLAVGMLLWFLPHYLLLSMQAVMIDIEQLRIIVSGLLPVLLLFTVGLHRLISAPRIRTLAGIAALTLLLAAGTWSASLVRAPVDSRTAEYFDTPAWKRLPPGFEYPDTRTVEQYWEDWAVPLVVPNYFEVLHSTRYLAVDAPTDVRWWDFQEPDVTRVHDE